MTRNVEPPAYPDRECSSVALMWSQNSGKAKHAVTLSARTIPASVVPLAPSTAVAMTSSLPKARPTQCATPL